MTRSSFVLIRRCWSRGCLAGRGRHRTSTHGGSRCGWRRSTPWRPISTNITKNSPAPTRPATSCSPSSGSPTSSSSTICRTRSNSADQDEIRGHVLSNGIDGNGRLIGFIYPGDNPLPDGSAIFVDNPLVDASINASLLRQGHSYPTFYATLPGSLRDHLADASRAARAAAAPAGVVAPLHRRPRRGGNRAGPRRAGTARHLAQAVPTNRPVPGERVHQLRRLRRLAARRPGQPRRRTVPARTRSNAATCTTSSPPVATRSN